MHSVTQAYAATRTSLGAVLLGSGIGLGLGAVFLAAGMAGHAADYAHEQRMAEAAASGYALSHLEAAGPGLRTGMQRYGFKEPADARPAPIRFGGLTFDSPKRNAAKAKKRSDLECLTQAVYYEARGESPSGQYAVAQVVMNRVKHRAFPKSVCGVVFQGAGRRTGCQFSFACDGSMRGRREGAAWERARRVAARALDGYVYAPVGNATHFHTTAVNPRWSGTLTRVTQVGQHIFYRFGNRRGRGGGQFTYTPDRAAPREVETLQASLVPTEVLQDAGERVVSAFTGEPTAPVTVEPQTQPQAQPATPPVAEIVVTGQPAA